MDLVTLRRKIGKTFFDMNHCIIFLDPSPSVTKIKTKIKKRDLIKLKSFCSTKETINKMKRQSTEWGKISGKKATYTGLISKIHKQLTQLNIKKNPNQKMAEGQNRHFSKKDIQMAKKHMKRSSITREMQIKTIVMYHLTPLRQAIIIKPTNNTCWRGCREKGTLLYCWRECNLVQSLQRRVERLKLVLLYDSEISFLGIYPEKTIIQKDTCTPMFPPALFTTAKTWKQPKCPLTEEWKQTMWYTYRMEYYSAIKKRIK